MTVVDPAAHHARIDPHTRGSRLADTILGGQDGLVNVLGVILGVAAASSSARLVLAAGLAATFAESVSMAGVAYTSSLAEGDLYESERAREYRHVRNVPSLEREEIRALYGKKGFEGEMLTRIVDTITANEDVWVAVMMAEEHRLTPVDRRASRRSAAVVGLASLIGSFVPLLPFLFLPVAPACAASIVLTASVLFGVGAYKARVTIGRPWKSGLEMAAIGIVSALAGFAAGAAFPGAR